MSPESTGTVERVRATLAQDPRTKDKPIEVAERNGIITLTGTVTSQETRDVAENLAAAQKGVVTVINDLTVDQDQGFFEPYEKIPPAVDYGDEDNRIVPPTGGEV